MANAEQLEILKQGVEAWNEWREQNPHIAIDLSAESCIGLILKNVNLSGANLYMTDFTGAQLYKANLTDTNLMFARFNLASLKEVDFTGAKLESTNFVGTFLKSACMNGLNFRNCYVNKADFSEASLIKCNFINCNLRGVNFFKTDLSHSNLSWAILEYGNLVETNLENVTLRGCRIYGLSVWNLKGTPRDQTNLVITPANYPTVTLDNLQLGQFVYSLLNNSNLRDFFDIITTKVVLILGRFTENRKHILDEIRSYLQTLNVTPIIFDFDKPASKDLTGTVETLARMAKFIIADLTDPASIPFELATIIKDLRTTPVLPIIMKGHTAFSMFADYQRSYPWVLPTHEYQDGTSLIDELSEVIAPANEMAEAFRKMG